MVEQLAEALSHLCKSQFVIADRLAKANLDRPDVQNHCNALLAASRDNSAHIAMITDMINSSISETRYEVTDLTPEQMAAADMVAPAPSLNPVPPHPALKPTEEVIRDMQQS